MKFMKSRRTVLIMTVLLAVMLSVVGGTFAWFTDSVESTSNEIKSGTLDLELFQKTEEGEWQNVADLTEPMFSYDLWEPGYTMWKALKVENKGTLALKWKAMFEMEGEMSKLAEVIDVYAREGSEKPERSEIPANSKDTYPTNENSVWWYDGTLKDFIENSETNTYGSLEAGEARELTLVLKMREEAGNEYQNLTLGAFNLKIVATQDTVEKDSFDEQYDADAEYPGPAKVSTEAEFFAALAAAEGEMIITAPERLTVYIPAENIMVKDGLTIQNIDFIWDGSNGRLGSDEGGTEKNTVTFENCSFTGRGFRQTMGIGSTIYAGGTEGANHVFNNCTFNGALISSFANNDTGTCEFNECVFGLDENKFGYVNCMGGTQTFNSCSFDYTGGTTMGSNQYTRYNAVNSYSEKYTANVILNGCTLTGTGTQRFGSNSTLTINP